jgi:hypothetical protein
MNKTDTFGSLFTSQLTQAGNWGFFLNLLLTGLLAYLLGRIYVRYGMAISNRKSFSRNFVLLSMTTMLVISIVQTSLALSLGLIGALSIVRFRAAIKEPEELTYLFFSIAIGLGFGANQHFMTITAFMAICLLIWLKSKSKPKENNQQGYLTITSRQPEKWNLQEVDLIIREAVQGHRLRRFDIMDGFLEAMFLVILVDTPKLQEIDQKLRQKDSSIQLIFINAGEELQ